MAVANIQEIGQVLGHYSRKTLHESLRDVLGKP